MIELINLFHEHRKKVAITCDEKCFCWDIEKYINQQEEIFNKEDAYYSERDFIDDYLNR